MKLTDLQQALEADTFETSLQPASEEIAIERLLVAIPSDQRDDFVIELLFIPGLEKEIENSKLLQFFVLLPGEVKEKEALGKLLLKLNINLPLPAFGLHEEDNFVYFKYVLPLSNKEDASDPSVVVETVWLIAYLIETFYSTIAEAMI